MKYKGKKIDKPTLEMVIEYCNKKQVRIDAKQLFDECERLDWRTTTGAKTKSLEAFVSSRKSFYIENTKQILERRRNKAKKKLRKVVKANAKLVENITPIFNVMPAPKEKKKTYSELLQDPRWQKKRLEIYQRDNWTCQLCGNGLNDGVPLNVHHKVYHRGKAPWEYDGKDLLTICEKCHEKLHGKA